MRILFVGPSGQQGKLERAALKIHDLRLRPHVIYNFLAIRHALHGGPPPPPYDGPPYDQGGRSVTALIAKHGGLRAHIDQHARRVHDVAVERATALSLIHI